MKERKSKRAHEAADNGCNDRGAEQSKDTAQLIEFKWCTIESLDEPCSNDRALALAKAKTVVLARLRSPSRLAAKVAATTPMTTGHRAVGPSATRNPEATPAAGQNTAMPSVLSSKARLRRAARKKTIATEIEMAHGGHVRDRALGAHHLWLPPSSSCSPAMHTQFSLNLPLNFASSSAASNKITRPFSIQCL